MNKIKLSLGIFIFVFSLGLFFNSSAIADKVYLSSGKSVTGKVTEKNGKVIVLTEEGKRLVFKKSEVLYIAKDKTTASDRKKPPVSDKNKDNDSKKNIPSKEDKDKPTSKKSDSQDQSVQTKKTSLDGTITPEHEIFRYMRKQNAAIKSGKSKDTYKSRIINYRAKLHDQEICFRGKWINQERLEKIYDRFDNLLKEAKKALRPQARPAGNGRIRPRIGDINPEKLKKAREKKCLEILKQAAILIPDLTLRKFYMGVCAFKKEKFTSAGTIFSSCIKRDPLNYAYYQGAIRSYFNAKNYKKAFKIWETFAKKFPNAEEPFILANVCFRNMPGKLMKKDYVQRAQKLLRNFKKRFPRRLRRSNNNISRWWFPDRGLSTTGGLTLPKPSSYYYQTRNALAVPTTTRRLTLDRGALVDACKVFVEVKKGVYAEAKFTKVKSTSKNKTPNLVTITVPGYSFTPVETSAKSKISTVSKLIGYTVNWLSSLGSKKRKFTSTVGAIDSENNIVLKSGVAPGETAAPIFDNENNFVGFIPGYTNCMQEVYSPRLYNVKDLKKLFRNRNSTETNRAKPEEIEGNVFKIKIIRAYKMQ